MATINYTAIAFINKYKHLPSGLKQLLVDAVNYWETANPSRKVIIPTTVNSQSGGALYTGTAPSLDITLVLHAGGQFPVRSIEGRATFF